MFLKRSLLTVAAVAAISAFASSASHAAFLDLTSVTSGTSGSFTGTLNGISVNGSITTTNAGFAISGTGATIQDSIINNTSPQYSYSGIYTPSIAATDQVGYVSNFGTRNPATITINFGSAITNPVFNVANLDSMQYSFASTAGLSSLILLSGNGGGGDGLQVVGTVISDANPLTAAGTPATTTPPTTGARSGYGSVELVGTFTSLTINVDDPASLRGDGGSFTLSATPAAVPEPGSVALLIGMATVGVGVLRKRRK